MALKHEPTRDEVAAAKDDISSWLASLKHSSAPGKSTPTTATVRPVAGAAKGAVSAAAAATDDDDKPWTEAEKLFAATREKQKGNEAFHANELEQAMKHYTASLQFVPGSAIVLANRYRQCAPVARVARPILGFMGASD